MKNLSIKNAATMRKDFKGFCQRMYRQLKDWEDPRQYMYQELAENPEKASEWDLVLKGTEIIALIQREQKYDILFLTPTIVKYQDARLASQAISAHYQGLYIVCASDMGKEFEECSFKCSFNKEYEYNLEGCITYYVPKGSDVNLFRDKFEQDRFPEYDAEKVIFRTIEGDEINKYLLADNWNYQYPMMRDDNHNYTIAGFHYLQPDFQPQHKLLVAEINGKPIATIKTGKYKYGEYDYIGLNYIDVCEPYRRKGLAKTIIKEFSEKCNDTSLPFVLSQESKMGEKCRMADHFKAEMSNAITRSDFEEECYQKYLERKKEVAV